MNRSWAFTVFQYHYFPEARIWGVELASDKPMADQTHFDSKITEKMQPALNPNLWHHYPIFFFTNLNICYRVLKTG
jgi:hypothetical protein